MGKVEWHRAFGPYGHRAGFTRPCQGDYSWGNGEGSGVIDICSNPEKEKHGHVHIATDSGKVRLPICCYSQEGVFKVFSFYDTRLGFKDTIQFTRLRDIILNQREVLELPMELTQAEKEFYESPEAMEKLSSLLFVNPKRF